MVQASGQPRLAEESLGVVTSVNQVWVEDLDGHVQVQIPMMAFIDDPRGAFANSP
jgi:hypothetical protein